MSTERYFVLKVGGSLEGEAAVQLSAVLRDVQAAGWNAVVVHGGGPRISRALAAAGFESRFVNGMRLTSQPEMEIVAEVLATQVNGEIVNQLRQMGVPAFGMSGAEGIVSATPLPGMDHTGEVKAIDSHPLEGICREGSVPVLAPVGFEELSGELLNVNADLVAGAVAVALEAERLVFLTDVPGIYEDFQTKTLLHRSTPDRLITLLEQGKFSSGMIPKVQSVIGAASLGVRNVFVIDGRDEMALRWGLGLSMEGYASAGTWIEA